MPVIIPNINVFPNNLVSVTSMDATPYFMIINSMGSYIYQVTKLYLKANNNSQILESYKFNRYDVNGKLQSFFQIPTIDPYQFQSSKFIEMNKENVVLDGRTSFNFEILPNESLFIILYNNQIANRNFVPATNFLDDEIFNRQFNVLNDYQETI